MIMKLRFIESGENSLKEYLRPRYNLTELARKVGISYVGFNKVLTGETKRSGIFQNLADILGMKLDFDEDGTPYLETNARIGSVSVELDSRLAQLYEVIKERPGADRALELMRQMQKDELLKWIEIGEIIFTKDK